MMQTRALALGGLLAAGTLMMGAPAAQAGGYGCEGDCYRETVLPPVYDTVGERVLLSVPRTTNIVRPPVYKTVTETVEIAPARREWRVTRDAWGHRIGCWVDVPAQYGLRQRTVMVEPGSVVPYTSYPVYGVRTHQVMVEPARRAWVPAGHGPLYSEPGPIVARY